MHHENRKLSVCLPHPGWLALGTAVFVIAGFALSIWMPHYRQQQAIRKIESRGGNFTIRNDSPEWLARRFGTSKLTYFDHVTHVQIVDAAIADADLSSLSGLTSISFLNLSRTPVGDGGLAHLSGMKSLENLWLGGTHVSDAGLKHLSNLTNLTDLSLEGTEVSDSGLKNLSGLKKLEWLNLHRTHVSPEGLKAIQKALPVCEICY